MKKGHFFLTAAVVVSVTSIGIAAVTMPVSIKNSKEEDVIYQDVAAEYGILAVGITKTVQVSPKMTEQAFDLDVGALEGGSFAPLQVEEVLVCAGQQVQKGTALLRVTSDSVRNTRTILQREVLDTNSDCALLQARQKELRMQASQGYSSDVIDGKYAGVVYHNKCEELQKKADDAKEAVDEKQNQVNENLLELVQAQQELAEARKYLKEAEMAVLENYENRYNNAYYYTTYENTMKTALNMVEYLEKQVENLTKRNESLLYEVDEALRAYHQFAQDLEKGKLAAKLDYDAEIHAFETASEWYDIQMASLDNALQEARGRCQTALQDIRAFDSYIVHGQVLSEYNGVVSAVMVEAGSAVSKDDPLIVLYDGKSVTTQVPLSEQEYLAIDPEKNVSIFFADDPNDIYVGRITGISNKECDDRFESPSYSITVAIQGDVSGFREGMTGDMTFLTEEVKEVLYVPDKAIFKEDGRPCVKMRDKKGKIVEKNVITGISDGIYVEITDGLSAGDRVLLK